MKVNWDTKDFMRQVERERKSALTKAALLVVRSVKDSFGSSGIPNATKKQRESSVSAPGEPPHVQTGFLKKNIAYELVGNDTAHVGANKDVKYAYWLEYGTPKMKARPYLRPALIREKKKILKIFKGIF